MAAQGSEPPSDPGPRGDALMHGPLGFRCLLEKLPAGAYTCDAEGLITYFNPQAVRLWGRSPKLNAPVDRFCGALKLLAPDGSPIRPDQSWMARALQTGSEYNGAEIIVERPDGSRITVLANATPIHDASGRLLGAVNVLLDISDRKRAEETQALLAAIVESSEDAIISKTLDGHILSWNQGAERLFGYAAHEVVGAPMTLLIPPERHDEERSILERLGRGERIEHYETVRVAKGGRSIDVSLTISPVRDAAGRIIAASKVVRDITLPKQAQETLVRLKNELTTQVEDLRRLHEMNMRLATTLELKPILAETLRTAAALEGTEMGLLALCDSEQNELELGASLGFQGDFLDLVDRVPAGVGACGISFQERRRVVIEDVETDPLLAPYREAARRAGFRAVHSTPLITRRGEIVGVLSTHFRQPHRPSERETRLIDLCARQAVDFIENARLYEQVRAADRRKDEFLATLAHELRNPLAPISNSLHLLRLSSELSPAVQRVREIMQRQVSHLVRLVDDLMEVSRITRGKIELRKEPVELAAIIATAVEISRPLIDAAGHQLAITLSPEPLTLEADPVRLAQVIANLLSNAAKYTEDGGQIWLSARQDGGEVVLSVRDTGVGIPADMLHRVFDMFTQVDRTLNRAQGGLGIGLTLARSFVEMHGGRMEAHSDGPGKGSEFLIRMPMAPGACGSARATPRDSVMSATLAAAGE
jgi:PAS domain S-box-containing protein